MLSSGYRVTKELASDFWMGQSHARIPFNTCTCIPLGSQIPNSSKCGESLRDK